MTKKKEYSIGKWLGMLYRRRDCYFDRELEKYGIGPGQYRLLRVLFLMDNGGEAASFNQAAIAKESGLDKGGVARSLKKLEDEGYIIRSKCVSDGRAKNITLTAKTHKLHEALWGIRHKWTEILGHGFSDKEKETAVRLMQAMAKNADTYFCEKDKHEGKHND